jgi:nicotinate-nucleotide adenylyltransferase
MANAVQQQLTPDLLLWVPSYHAPHKQERPPADATTRLALLEAVVEGRPREQVCRLEIERQGYSFMVDTLCQLQELYPSAAPTLLLGADSLQHLLTWRDVPELFQRVKFTFVPRPGWGEQQLQDFRQQLAVELAPHFRADFLAMEEVAVSSTEIRAALAAGEMPRGLPLAVSEQITANGYYGFTKA